MLLLTQCPWPLHVEPPAELEVVHPAPIGLGVSVEFVGLVESVGFGELDGLELEVFGDWTGSVEFTGAVIDVTVGDEDGGGVGEGNRVVSAGGGGDDGGGGGGGGDDVVGGGVVSVGVVGGEEVEIGLVEFGAITRVTQKSRLIHLR